MIFNRISDLSNPSKKFKVETNAKQLFLTGCILLFKDCNIVIVEGGQKQIRKYNRYVCLKKDLRFSFFKRII